MCRVASLIFLGLLLPEISHSAPCWVGTEGQPPTIEITSAPASQCGGPFVGQIVGLANNVDTTATVVVLYAETDQFYCQPFADDRRFTRIRCTGPQPGSFQNSTRGGCRYWAVLADTSWDAPCTLPCVPSVGGPILGIACSPCPRTVDFAGRQWDVKTSGCCNLRLGPGPNYFSDSPSNVFVDGDGRLHLKITQGAKGWDCAEVIAQRPLGYGEYLFELASRVDTLPRPVVLGCFTYECQTGEEIDVEFAGDALIPGMNNFQHVVQPYTTCHLERFLMPPEATSSHRFTWEAGRITFLSWRGKAPFPPPSEDIIAVSKRADACIPVPEDDRMRFNLWLFDENGDGVGDPPPNGQPVEVIIQDFRYSPDVVGVPGTTRAPLGTKVLLGQNAPNPFAASTTFSFETAMGGLLTVEVLDVSGRRIRMLMTGTRDPGSHSIRWDGRDDGGFPVRSGLYWYRVLLGNEAVARRMLVLR